MNDKILIISVYFNQENFIQYQISCLKKNLQDEFVFCLFDNSPDGNSYLEKNSFLLGFDYFRVPQDIFTSGGDSVRAGQSLNYAISESFRKYPEIEKVMILDSDMFPVSKFNFDDLLEGKDFAGIAQNRGHVFYYNNQLVAFRKNRIKEWENFSFDVAIIEGQNTDCGGKFFFFFRDDNPHLERKDFMGIHSNQLSLYNDSFRWEMIRKMDPEGNLVRFFESDCKINNNENFSEIYDSNFLHFRAGSNWINFGEREKLDRERNLFDYLEKITQE